MHRGMIVWKIYFLCLLELLHVWFANFSSFQGDPLRGHLMPLGMQGSPSFDTVILTGVPEPGEFFDKYYSKRKPVLFKNAAKMSRAFSLWTPEYIKKNYGNATVRIETRSEAERNIPVGDLGIGLDKIGSFITRFKESNTYLISQIPEPMEKDIYIPKCLSCKFLSNAIQGIHLFITAKGGKTLLHRDPYSNIHCVFNGTKNWILVPPKQTPRLYMSPESEFEWGGFSEVDVDQVDLKQFPMIKDLEYSEVTVDKGDCIFMPGGYWHQVRSHGDMNTAVSIWITRYEDFYSADCKTSLNLSTSNQYPLIWRYSGQGDVVHGAMDIYVLQQALLEWADTGGVVNVKSFTERFFTLTEDNFRRQVMVDDMTERRQSFAYFLDPDKGMWSTLAKIKNLTPEELKILVELIHPNEVSNTERHEYCYVQAPNIRDIMHSSLTESGVFDDEKFRSLYTEMLGGTPKRALELIKKVQDFDKPTLTLEELDTAMPTLLIQYTNCFGHDPATERELYKFLTARGKVTKHDEL